MDLKKLRLLYAEDDDTTRDALLFMLNKFFGDVIPAKNGKEGIALFKESIETGNNIDLILSDINMPKMNGLDMIKNIKDINSEIPAVLVTAHSETDYLLEAINMNVSQYLVKPIDVTNLFEKLKLAYLPIFQKNEILSQKLELEQLNEKIKEVAKQEMESMRLNDDYLSDGDIDFGDFLDNITLDK